mmetsp:Transcript_16882/g.55226  ORF Transcript_16882/g.55226 Transcript_16882/m.55226 type:complete len:289 (+) Transcript_16882:1266-2132(+)
MTHASAHTLVGLRPLSLSAVCSHAEERSASDARTSSDAFATSGAPAPRSRCRALSITPRSPEPSPPAVTRPPPLASAWKAAASARRTVRCAWGPPPTGSGAAASCASWSRTAVTRLTLACARSSAATPSGKASVSRPRQSLASSASGGSDAAATSKKTVAVPTSAPVCILAGGAPLLLLPAPALPASMWRPRSAWQMPSAGIMKGSTRLSKAYPSTSATLGAACRRSRCAVSTSPHVATRRQSRTLWTLLFVCSSERNSKKRSGKENLSVSGMMAGATSSAPPKSLSA